MTLNELKETLDLEPAVMPDHAAEKTVSGAYCGDLLSDVMAHAPAGAVWFTVQTHMNVIAVAQLTDVACVVLVNGTRADAQAEARARQHQVPLFRSPATSAELCMALAEKLG